MNLRLIDNDSRTIIITDRAPHGTLVIPHYTKNITRAGTHSGVFHADDVMAAAIIKLAFPQAEIIRTRDTEILQRCDIIFDVGAEFDPGIGRFDHHQTGRAGSYLNGVQFSSAGLIWAALAHRLDVTGRLYELVTERLIMPIDAIDNGQDLAELKTSEDGGYEGYSLSRGVEIAPRFEGVAPWGLGVSSILDYFNPSWDEDANFDAGFLEAVRLSQTLLARAVKRAKGQLAAESMVNGAMNTRQDPRIVVLDKGAPWQEIVVQDPATLFVVFPSELNEWMVQCVPPFAGSFDKRVPLPMEWSGKRGADLVELTGVHDAIFCHPGVFICGAKSKEGAMELAELALALQGRL